LINSKIINGNLGSLGAKKDNLGKATKKDNLGRVGYLIFMVT